MERGKISVVFTCLSLLAMTFRAEVDDIGKSQLVGFCLFSFCSTGYETFYHAKQALYYYY